MQDHFIIEKNYSNVHYQNMFRQLYTLVVDKLEFPNDYNWIQEGDHILKNIQQYLITYDPKDNLFFPEGIKLKDVQNNSAESEACVSNVFGSSKVTVKNWKFLLLNMAR